MIKILISGSNGIIGHELINVLKKKYYVVAIDNQTIGSANLNAKKFYKCPKGYTKEFIKFIEKIHNTVDLMFFYVDEELLNISRNLKNKKILNKIIISDRNTIELCDNKNKLNHYLSKYINIPKLNNKKSIIKPIHGRGSKNIITTNSKKIINFFKKDKTYITQEFIDGNEYTVDCLFNKQNTLIFSLARRRIVASNISLINKIEKNKTLHNLCKKISKHIKFYGPVNFQFIIDKKTKKIYLIEINPRLSGGVIFSIKSGFNIIDMAIKTHIGKKINFNVDVKYNKTYFRYLKTETL